MKTYHSLRKKPKDGSWKRILWELEEQDVFVKCRDDCSFTVYGDFSDRSINAFTDKWKFTVIPFTERGIHVFPKDARWFAEFRPGFFEGLMRVGRLVGYARSFYFDFSPWNSDHFDSRYVVSVIDLSRTYFYMDRVI